MNSTNRINGFPVHVLRGKEVSATPDNMNQGAHAKVNGPHHDAKWAKYLLRHLELPRVIDSRRTEPMFHPNYRRLYIGDKHSGNLTVCC